MRAPSPKRATGDATVLFLCPHAAAKSLLASALFARGAQARGLAFAAACAGTEPDAGPMPEVVALLAAEGIDVSAHRPRRVTPAQLAAASRVITLGCDVGALLPPGVTVEAWHDVPLPSRDLPGARRVIGGRVAALLDELCAAPRG